MAPVNIFIRFRFVLVVIFVLLFSRFSHAEEYLFSAPPTEDLETSLEIYNPVAAFLSDMIGEQVTYQYPGNWPAYLNKMQRAQYDLILDAPHFISWRIEKIEHHPIVSLADAMRFVVVVAENGGLGNLIDLRGKPACSASIPNLDALTLLDQYDSNWTQPVIKPIQGFDNMLEALKAGECDATVVPKRVFERYNNEQPGVFKIIFETFDLPHYGFSVSPRISVRIRNRIQNALLSSDADEVISGIYQQFGLDQNTEQLLEIEIDDYRGFAYLLSDFWGF